MTQPDYRCYFVTGTGTSEQKIVDTAREAARGGAGIIQVRSKPISALNLYLLTQAIAREVGKVNPETKILVDDRVDIYLALKQQGENVHGVHVGQDDMPVPAVRALVGPEAIVGLTTGTKELIVKANQQAELLDYVGCGPFRATPTKDSGRTPLGLAGYRQLVPLSQLPVVAIGDVTKEDAASLAATGVSGLAVVRGIMNAANPRNYCQELIKGFAQ